MHRAQFAATPESTGLANTKLNSAEIVVEERVNRNPLHFYSDPVTLKLLYLLYKHSNLNSYTTSFLLHCLKAT